MRAEVVHSVREELSLICGCALATHPSAYASISVSITDLVVNSLYVYVHSYKLDVSLNY